MISYVIRDTASVSPCPAASERATAVQHVTEERSGGTIGGCKAVRHGLRTGGEPGKWEASSLLSPASPPDVAVADGYAGAADGRDGGKSMPTTDG